MASYTAFQLYDYAWISRLFVPVDYLATDSEEVKREMKERYGDRIFCSGKKADRGSLEGIREGITDMYTLARTQKIYGSFQSSFSDMAAQIGGVPLEILKL